MKKIIIVLLFTTSAMAIDPRICNSRVYAEDGTYLGMVYVDKVDRSVISATAPYYIIVDRNGTRYRTSKNDLHGLIAYVPPSNQVQMQANYGGYHPSRYYYEDDTYSKIGDQLAKSIADIPNTIREEQRRQEERNRYLSQLTPDERQAYLEREKRLNMWTLGLMLGATIISLIFLAAII